MLKDLVLNPFSVYKNHLMLKVVMRFGVLGINHKSADLVYREMLAKACYRKLRLDSLLAEQLSCVLLMTCNRTEIYFSADDLAAAHSLLLHALREEIETPFEHKLYAYFGCDCFSHLAKVTAGLDSMIVAESEIQRQVKLSYEQTCLHYSLPSCMHFLFQKSLQMGKLVRSQLPCGNMTLPKMVHALSSHLCPDLSNRQILFIGNSEVNRKVMGHFKSKGIQQITLCTRSLTSAQSFARQHQLQLIDWSQLFSEHLRTWDEFDVVIAGTNASNFLLKPQDLSVANTRVIFDLGVPRNVDPRLARHPLLTLFNVDELGEMIVNSQVKHVAQMDQAERLIEEKVQNYVCTFRHKQKRVVQCV